jgi:hypothetical protein
MSGTTDDQDDKILVPDGPDIDVEVVDDTPEHDRGRTRRPEGQPADIPEDEEIATYAESARKRIQKMRYEFHEERRAGRKSSARTARRCACSSIINPRSPAARLRPRPTGALHGARTAIEDRSLRP